MLEEGMNSVNVPVFSALMAIIFSVLLFVLGAAGSGP